MPLCPSGQKAIIQWQYSGEDKQQILGADDYTVKPGYSNPHQYFWYWEATVTWKDVFSNNRVTRNYNVSELRFGSASIVGIQIGYPRFDLINLPDYNNSNLIIPYEQANAQGQVNLANYNLYFARSYRPESLALTKLCISPGGSSPYQCAANQPTPTNCKFSVTKNGQVVYSKTNPQCPVVTHTCGEQCPAGSCECSCGTEICCHHPTTGKVIKSFTR